MSMGACPLGILPTQPPAALTYLAALADQSGHPFLGLLESPGLPGTPCHQWVQFVLGIRKSPGGGWSLWRTGGSGGKEPELTRIGDGYRGWG